MRHPTSAPTEADFEEVISRHPLATLITPVGEELKISHIPLVLEKRGEDRVLVGHMARSNPHVKVLEGGFTTAVFHGPQAYITPLWYQICDVPTWNYVVLHWSGRARLLDTAEETVGALRKLTDRMEGQNGWEFQIPSDLSEPGQLQKAIVAFELPVLVKSAKFKLSQNKSSTDYAGVLRGLAARGEEQSANVLDWMRRLAERVQSRLP